MKTSPETLAKLLAPIIWADGVYAEEERETVNTIAEVYGIESAELAALVDAALKEVEPMSQDEVNEYLESAGEEIEIEERGPLYQAALQMALSDGILAEEEVTNLLSVAAAMELPVPQAILLLCDMVKSEPDMEVEFAK